MRGRACKSAGAATGRRPRHRLAPARAGSVRCPARDGRSSPTAGAAPMARGIRQPRAIPRLGDPRGRRRHPPRPERYGDDLGDHVITCASGASPSGPVHLGNLREFLTVHFVAEEIKRRGIPARHLHSWDDFDRFRKVPAGIDPSWSEHIGRPLSAVPDPWGCHESWAEHYKEPLVDVAARARRRDGRGLPDRDVPRRRLPRADPHRRTPSRRDRGGDGALPDQAAEARPRRPRARRRRPRWPTPWPTTTSPG